MQQDMRRVLHMQWWSMVNMEHGENANYCTANVDAHLQGHAAAREAGAAPRRTGRAGDAEKNVHAEC